MGWYTYYKLLEKYVGDLEKATPEEMKDAALSNPNTPSAARELAERKWLEKELRYQNALAPDLVD